MHQAMPSPASPETSCRRTASLTKTVQHTSHIRKGLPGELQADFAERTGPEWDSSGRAVGKAPRRRVHSLSGIAAIAGCGLPPPRIIIGHPAHQAQSGAEPVVLSRSRECCSRSGPQRDTVRNLAGRDQAPQRDQQLARQCHDHCGLTCTARRMYRSARGCRQGAV
jgi:hypothetical protein